MNKLKSLIYLSVFLGFLTTAQTINVLAQDEEETVETQSNDTQIYDFKPSGMKYYGSSTSALSRKVTSAIGVYVKNGTVPKITRYDSTYLGTAIHVMTVDASNGDTFLQVDYADSPAFLNNFYDSTLTKNDEYYWAGSINAGFFNATASSNSYGLATGAVRHNYAWETYSYVDGTYYGELQPSYGNGFVTAYFNKNDDFQLIYNGWKGGVFYKYYGDSDPNTWDYSPVWDYSEGVSGGYTLLVDGNETHWGKDDYSGTNYWNYTGTAITLFGQKANGDYVLVTTTAGSLSASNQVALMKQLGCTDAIRFDGGGSSQMAYTNGLTLASASVSSNIEADDIDTNNIIDYVNVTVKDSAGTSHSVKASDIVRKNGVAITDNGDNTYAVSIDTVVGTLKTTVKEKTVNKHTVNFYDFDNKLFKTVYVEDGKAVNEKEIGQPEKDGYVFDGWNKTLTKITADLNVYPAYYCADGYDVGEEDDDACVLIVIDESKTIKIHFDWNYANSGFVNDVTIKQRSSIELPDSDYIKQGYKFIEWNTKIDGSGTSFESGQDLSYAYAQDFLSEGSYDLTLYAQWQKEENPYVVSFDWNYANAGYVGDIISSNGKVVLPQNNYMRNNYKFVGWNTQIDGNGTMYQPDDVIEISENIKIYAMWEKDDTQFTVTFDWNYANSGFVSAITGSTITLPEITYYKDNHHATGWNTQMDGNGITYQVGEQITLTDNLVLYPIWIEDEQQTTVIVSFDWNYADTGFVNDIKATAGNSFTLPENGYQKDGYEFVGWSTDVSGSVIYYAGEQFSANENVRLFAIWKQTDVQPTIAPTVEPTVEPTIEPTIKPTTEPSQEPQSYEVTFKAIDGTFANVQDNIVVTVTDNMTFNDIEKPSKDGYTFVGWDELVSSAATIEESTFKCIDDNEKFSDYWNNRIIYAHFEGN